MRFPGRNVQKVVCFQLLSFNCYAFLKVHTLLVVMQIILLRIYQLAQGLFETVIFHKVLPEIGTWIYEA